MFRILSWKLDNTRKKKLISSLFIADLTCSAILQSIIRDLYYVKIHEEKLSCRLFLHGLKRKKQILNKPPKSFKLIHLEAQKYFKNQFPIYFILRFVRFLHRNLHTTTKNFWSLLLYIIVGVCRDFALPALLNSCKQ